MNLTIKRGCSRVFRNCKHCLRHKYYDWVNYRFWYDVLNWLYIGIAVGNLCYRKYFDLVFLLVVCKSRSGIHFKLLKSDNIWISNFILLFIGHILKGRQNSKKGSMCTFFFYQNYETKDALFFRYQ
jgi:hypothetical protein